MAHRGQMRLDDILDAIQQIDKICAARDLTRLPEDRVVWAAFERFVEIVSEASRHVPADLKESDPEIPWQRIADIGNHLRHAYHRVDPEILWRLYSDGHLAALRAAIIRYRSAKRPEGST